MGDVSVKNRLIDFLEFTRLSKSEFGRRIGVSSSYVSAIRKSIQPEKLAAITKEFPQLNIDWLLTGEGSMLKNQDDDYTDDNSAGNPKLIPFYDAETTGGYDGLVSSSGIPATLRGYVNAGGWFGGKETAAIRHTGDSMTEYPDGCILAVREVRERRLLVPGKNYVIETDEFRVTKRVQRGSHPDTIALYSTNREKYDDGHLVYEPFEVELADIRRIFSVLGYIVNQSGEIRLIK